MHGTDAVLTLDRLCRKDLDEILLDVDAFIGVFLAQVLEGRVAPDG